MYGMPGQNPERKSKKIPKRYHGTSPDAFFLFGHPKIFINKFYIIINHYFP